jgi:hypothetical protein
MLAREARKILWTKKDDKVVVFGNKNISSNDCKHWDSSTCKLQDCNVCDVLAPTSDGWFSDERIFPMTNTSHMLYERLCDFKPRKIQSKRRRITHKTPLRLLDVTSGETTYDTAGKNYFTVSHVWSSGNFGIPFSKDDKGYPWLKRMSKLLKIRHAWIDTYCIHQDSVEEKQHEIGNMREYYANADSCAVLFSSTTPRDVDMFIANIQLLAHKAVDNPYRRLGHVWALASVYHSNMLVDEWFKRVWTIQEIMLSRSVVVDSSCGLVDLTELLKSYHVLVLSLGEIAMCGSEMDQARTLSYHLHNGTDSHDMATVLELCMGRQATNGHDYVYGVLGLLPNIHVEVNYKLPLECVMLSLFRGAIENGDLSWISWIGPSSLKTHSFIPVIGSSLHVDRWNIDANDVHMTLEEMTMGSNRMDVEIVGIAKWDGIYAGVANVCKVLEALCLGERLCCSCLVTRLCDNGCCTPHTVHITMAMAFVNGHPCENCIMFCGQWSDECSKHMEEMFAKRHDSCVVLMKTLDNKYLVGKIHDQLVPDKYQQVVMFGKQEVYGWIISKHNRIGIVSSHERFNSLEP